MLNHKRNIFVFFAVLVVSTATILATLRSQNKDQKSPDSPALEKAKADFYTVADYGAQEPANAQKRALRRAREKRYNMRPEKGVDPKRFMITEDRQSSFGAPRHPPLIEPPLPAAQSDAVLVGEVLDAQAYLTEDKTSVISEFTVQITSVLKNNLASPFSAGGSITVNRAGGSVRFSSGKIIQIGHGGKPLPRIGRQYAFFLKYNNDEGQDFRVITAYELRAGRVFPLDGINLIGNVETAYSAYEKYKDAEEAAFLNDVRDSIVRNLGGEPQRGGSLR
jgi:hypothetical protein